MLALGILFVLAGISLKFVVTMRCGQMMAADMDDGMSRSAAWGKHAWYRAEDVPWLVLLAVGVMLILRAPFCMVK